MIEELKGELAELQRAEKDLQDYIKSQRNPMRDPEEHVTKERKKIIESIAMADVESEEFSDDSEL